MATITAAAGGGNFTTGGTWIGGVAPTSADDAVLDASSGNVTVDSGAECRSLNCTGYTGTLAFTNFNALSIGDGTAGAGNVALLLSAGMTLTLANSSSFIFASTSGTQQTISTGGKTLPSMTFDGAGGSWVLADNATLGSWSGITVTNGSFSDGGFNISCYSLQSSNSNTRSITISGTITLSADFSPLNFSTSTNLTATFTGSTVLLSYTGPSIYTFAGGGKTFNVVQVAMGGTGVLAIINSNTFAKLERSGTGTKNINFAAGTTTTLTGGADAFFGLGDGVNQLTIDTDSSGSAATIASSTNLICDWLSLKDITGPAGTNYAGDNSTDVSGNTNWVFTGAPAPTLSSIDPTSGSIAGGTEVTLTGTDLTGTTGVTFGGDAATSVTVVNDTTVTCVTPAHAAGAVDVVLTKPGGSDTLVGGFTYVPVSTLLLLGVG